MQESHKSILVARNGKGEFLIQDRAGHKPPAWGFFGGGIDEDETPIQALVRETKEELDIDLVDSDVIELGISETQWGDLLVVRHLFLYQTDQEEFTVLEGAGAHWLAPQQAFDRLDRKDLFKEILVRVEKVLE